MKKITIQINNGSDRENVLIALANAGYKVKIETEEHRYSAGGDKYFIVFECEDSCITNLK